MPKQLLPLVAAGLSWCIVGCSSAPVLDAEPIRISQAERYEYWLPMRKQVDLEVHRLSPEQRAQGGNATVEYLVDSRGRVADIRVVDSVPNSEWGRLAVRVVKSYGFEPALTNPERVPVIVTQQVVFQGSGEADAARQ